MDAPTLYTVVPDWLCNHSLMGYLGHLSHTDDASCKLLDKPLTTKNIIESFNSVTWTQMPKIGQLSH